MIPTNVTFYKRQNYRGQSEGGEVWFDAAQRTVGGPEINL